MPRTKLLPKREQEICQRLVEFRLASAITRAAIARGIGYNPFSLASIERKAAPVQFSVGYNFCLTFNRSLEWLATGRLPVTPFTPPSAHILNKIGPKTLFSQAYDLHLAEFVSARITKLAKDLGVKREDLGKGSIVYDGRRLGVSQAESHFERTLDFLRERAGEMQDDRKITFANQLADVAFKFWNLAIKVESAANNAHSALTLDSLKSKTSAVKSEIAALINRVNAAAAKPGAKAELARLLDVAPARVSEWLSGKKEPGGEYTLRLLRWVQEQERK